MNNFNNVKLIGSIVSKAVFSHEVVRKGEKGNENTNIIFLRFTLEVPRLSGVSDFLEVIISEEKWQSAFNQPEHTLDADSPKRVVEIYGHLQSHNYIDHETGKNKLNLFVLAKTIQELTTTAKESEISLEYNKAENLNTVFIEGFVCQKPIIRQTTLGRTIAEVLIAVNRHNGSSYIPVILWGGNAANAKYFEKGDKLQFAGRFQSREYRKIINGIKTIHTAYEMSASTVKLIKRDVGSSLPKTINNLCIW